MTHSLRKIGWHLVTLCLAGGVLLLLADTSEGASRRKRREAFNASAYTLKGQKVIVGSKVLLGDLFDGLNEAQAVEEAAEAPKPGASKTYNYRHLYNIARAHHLDWRPKSRYERAIITRKGKLVPKDEVENTIKASLKEKIEGQFSMDLEGDVSKIQVALGDEKSVLVKDIAYGTKGDRFKVTLSLGRDGKDEVAFFGKVTHLTEIPTLSRVMMPDDVIKSLDLKWVKVASKKLPANIVTDEKHLVGMSPKARIKPGLPVRLNEVMQPLAVKRGAMVTMRYKTNGMTLSLRGKAMDSGTVGGVVRVTNIKSRKVITGLVEGENLVLVS